MEHASQRIVICDQMSVRTAVHCQRFPLIVGVFAGVLSLVGHKPVVCSLEEAGKSIVQAGPAGRRARR